MKVVLLQDIAKIGRRFEIVDVPDGHALNKLIPQKMAEPATPENVKRVKARQEKIEADRVAADAAFAEAVEALGERTITMEMDANENGHLFKAVAPADIVPVLAEEGIHVTPEQVVVKGQIKELGTHTVQLVSGTEEVPFELEVVGK